MEYKSALLEKDVILDNDLSTDAIIAYIAIRLSDISLSYNTYMLYKQLEFNITGKTKVIGMNNHKLNQRIRYGVKELIDKGYIEAVSYDTKGIMVNSEKNLDSIKNDYYIALRDYEIQKIMSSGYRYKELLLSYYTCLVSTFYSGQDNADNFQMYGVGTQSLVYLSSISGISETCITRYNKKLEEYGLLYIKKSDLLIMNFDVNKTRITNCYCRPENKDNADKLQANREMASIDSGKKYSVLGDNSSFRNSLSNKYNQIKRFVNNDSTLKKEYTYSDIEQFYNLCTKENNRIKERINQIELSIVYKDISEHEGQEKISLYKNKLYGLSEIEEWLDRNK